MDFRANCWMGWDHTPFTVTTTKAPATDKKFHLKFLKKKSTTTTQVYSCKTYQGIIRKIDILPHVRYKPSKIFHLLGTQSQAFHKYFHGVFQLVHYVSLLEVCAKLLYHIGFVQLPKSFPQICRDPCLFI